jgi:Domain of unknown function (DUF4190)
VNQPAHDYKQSPHQPGYPIQPRTNGLAITALVFGILGFLVLPIVGSLVGIACGIPAKRSIEASNGRETGRELAIAGIILSAVGLAVWSGLLLFGFGIDLMQSFLA